MTSRREGIHGASMMSPGSPILPIDSFDVELEILRPTMMYDVSDVVNDVCRSGGGIFFEIFGYSTPTLNVKGLPSQQ
jgi:hypothetical protein